MEKIKAPIDNKNIMEWFTEDFHNNEFIEQTSGGIKKQVFYLCECLCELSYRFGDNWFRMRIIEGNPDGIKQCANEYRRISESFNTDEVCVKYNPYCGVYEFYLISD